MTVREKKGEGREDLGSPVSGPAEWLRQHLRAWVLYPECWVRMEGTMCVWPFPYETCFNARCLKLRACRLCDARLSELIAKDGVPGALVLMLLDPG